MLRSDQIFSFSLCRDGRMIQSAHLWKVSFIFLIIDKALSESCGVFCCELPTVVDQCQQ